MGRKKGKQRGAFSSKADRGAYAAELRNEASMEHHEASMVHDEASMEYHEASMELYSYHVFTKMQRGAGRKWRTEDDGARCARSKGKQSAKFSHAFSGSSSESVESMPRDLPTRRRTRMKISHKDLNYCAVRTAKGRRKLPPQPAASFRSSPPLRNVIPHFQYNRSNSASSFEPWDDHHSASSFVPSDDHHSASSFVPSDDHHSADATDGHEDANKAPIHNQSEKSPWFALWNWFRLRMAV